jgi:tetratricopeptide (TPR) repeat protein
MERRTGVEKSKYTIKMLKKIMKTEGSIKGLKIFFLLMIGDLMFLKKNFNGAIRVFSKLIKLQPDNFFVFYSKRGQAKYEIKDYKGAIQEFNKVLELNPENIRFILFSR